MYNGIQGKSENSRIYDWNIDKHHHSGNKKTLADLLDVLKHCVILCVTRCVYERHANALKWRWHESNVNAAAPKKQTSLV